MQSDGCLKRGLLQFVIKYIISLINWCPFLNGFFPFLFFDFYYYYHIFFFIMIMIII